MSRVEWLESRNLFAAGLVDATFGTSGSANIDFGGSPAARQSQFVKTDEGDRIVVAQLNAAPDELRIARLTRDGVADPTFAGGVAVIQLEGVQNIETGTHFGIAVDHRNRTLFFNGRTLRRLTASGKIDGGFGARGKVAIPVLTEVADIAIDTNSRVVLTGTAKGSAGDRMAVIRLDTDGTIDGSFGLGGAYKSPVPGREDDSFRKAFGQKVVVLDDGDIVIAGGVSYLADDAIEGVQTYRLHGNGRLDPTYGFQGGFGRRVVSTELYNQSATLVELDRDGSFFYRTTNELESDHVVTVDHSFVDAGGAMSTAIDEVTLGFSANTSLSFFRQDDGRTIIESTETSILFRRAEPNFARDNTFTSSIELAFAAAAQQRDGALLALPYAQVSDLSLTRLFPEAGPLARVDARNVLARSATTPGYFEVTFRSDSAINASTVGVGDFKVTLPDGTPRSTTFVSKTVLSNGQVRATYKFTAPGGWTDGTGSIRLLTNAVTDSTGDGTRGRTVGTFEVFTVFGTR